MHRKRENDWHETQPTKAEVLSPPATHPILEEAQRAEGGAPPKKVELGTMPKWLRGFGYGIFSVFVLLVILLILTSILR
ncbi:hypothetical protein NDK47_21820 [Brevibacillus ruminantium]|uniref:Amino acid transporter n=1 Tax=Brevibacillus ruminantium TaxID=2950604 RepID=A0ABY4WC35_9BACL|nr:hypothetical protein [Brevibacillus ruminantium]USG64737.1 hypothetical protein NDK47_21820 [Brevibacillus ruminantium]